MRRTISLALGCLSAVMAAFSALAAERPNIVLFLVDDLGWQDVSVPFWSEPTPFNRHFRTPHLERLARQGRLFTNAHACSVCSPTRVSIMTGQNAARHGVTNWILFPDRETSGKTEGLEAPANWRREGLQPGKLHTLPQLLHERAGYVTIHAGKAHWGAVGTPGADPLQLGFDVNIGGHAAGSPGHYHGMENFGNEKEGVRGVPGLEAYHGRDIHLTEALTLEAIEAVKTAVEAGRPFFLHLAHYAVHTPLQPHRPHLTNYENKRYAGTAIPIPAAEAIYASMVEGVDASLGSLLTALEEMGAAENTLVLFASDNGGLSYHSRGTTPRGTGRDTHGWPLREGKGSAYDGGTRIPMLVAWAQLAAGHPCQQRFPIPSGTRTSVPVTVEDYFPAILRWAGLKDRTADLSQRDGRDFTPALLASETGDTSSLGERRSLIFHYPHQWTGKPRGGYQPHSSIRRGPWKAIYFYASQTWELYNLEEDISETKNLIAREPDRLTGLARELKAYLESVSASWPSARQTGEPFPLALPAKALTP